MEPINFEIKKEKETQDLGRFVVEPLPAGYGMTLGTALRRTLLSSLPGGAIAEVRIQGVAHPFTTLKGVKEDVVEIIMNLKKVRFSPRGEGPYEATLEAKGKKTVTAKDIQISSEAQVANPELKIATLTDKDAKIALTLLVEKGTGYRSAEERGGGKVGVIPMDSIFSPVVKVGYWVEGTRVGRKTNFERLILEVATDGTLKPSEAISSAAEILKDCFGRLVVSRAPAKPVAEPEVKKEKKAAKKAPKKEPKKRSSSRKK